MLIQPDLQFAHIRIDLTDRAAAIDAVRALSADVGIPADLKEIVKPEDVQFLAESAYADACRPGNPRETSVEEIAALYRSLL
jgi:lactaldehyde reductase